MKMNTQLKNINKILFGYMKKFLYNNLKVKQQAIYTGAWLPADLVYSQINLT